MNTITINGATIHAKGNISISNGKVVVDGKDVTPDSKKITIIINGDNSQINADACERIEVRGNCGAIKTMSGDVEVSGSVDGDVKTMSGDVKCENISGSVSTMSGDIKCKSHK